LDNEHELAYPDGEICLIKGGVWGW